MLAVMIHGGRKEKEKSKRQEVKLEIDEGETQAKRRGPCHACRLQQVPPASPTVQTSQTGRGGLCPLTRLTRGPLCTLAT